MPFKLQPHEVAVSATGVADEPEAREALSFMLANVSLSYRLHKKSPTLTFPV